MSQPAVVAGKDLVGPLPLSDEEWREYRWQYTADTGGMLTMVYRVNNPIALYYRKGGTTHRVVDVHGVTHVVPAPGYLGAVLTWYAPSNPVAF
jgi:hypothetical protein